MEINLADIRFGQPALGCSEPDCRKCVVSGQSRKYWFAIIPAVFMMITTLASLIILWVNTYLPKQNWPLVITDIALLCLSVGVIMLAGNKFLKLKPDMTMTGK